MKRISTFTIATAFALILALGSAGTAQAAVDPQTVTLNGGAAWTIDGADGASVTVAPGATITVVLTVNAGADSSGNSDWKCTNWDIGGETSGEDDFEPDHTAQNFVGATETFDITAPASEGTFDLVLNARGTDGCSGGASGPHTLVDAVTVVVPLDIDVAKGNVMGPYDDEGDLGASASFAVSDGFGGGVVDGVVDVHQSGPDAGGIWIGLDDTQRYKFEITITNNGGLEANGTKITDVIPAEFDLDPGLHEDDVEDGGINGLCDGGNPTCDGDSGTFPGFVSDKPVKCMVVASQPDSADNDNPPPKQPEFLTIMLNGLDDETCTITVYVKTDQNPGGGESPGFEPTSCRLIAAAGGDVAVDIFDTITLNEGLKVFDPSNGERLSGPEGSLQLTCNIPD